MPIDSVTVGSNERQINVIGDPITAANKQNVIALADAKSLAGLYASLVGAIGLLQNTGGTYDLARSAPGTTGIPSINTEGTKKTYSAATLAFTPAATATDFWQILGSGTKTIRVTRVAISGIATAAATVDVQLVKRTTADSGGTPAAVNIMQHDSNDAAPTGAVNTFGANPTLGTTANAGRGQKLNLGAAGSAGQLIWDFTTRNGEGLVLRGAAQGLYLNWNGAAVPAGTSVDIEVEWTEE